MKINTIGIFYILIAIGIIIIFFTMVLQAQKEVIEIRELQVIYAVGDKTGFDLNSSALHFGKILPGSKSTRSVQIDNPHAFPVYVHFEPEPALEDFIIFDGASTKIQPWRSKEFSFTLNITPDTPLGNYTGVIVVYIRK